MKLKIKYRIAVFLLSLLSFTWRIKITGYIPKEPGIVAFWHGLMLPVWKFFSKYGSTAVVSLSKDGEILSTLLKKWNYSLIRGSSKKGGKEALNNIVSEDKNRFILITPDGPQGPACKFKPGAVVAAQRRQSPLYLCSVKITYYKQFSKSWDKFLLPLPFATIILDLSNPIIIDAEANRTKIDMIIAQAEQWLNRKQ